jgi:hypothetical protein
MGENNRRKDWFSKEMGGLRPLRPGQQIQVDLKNAMPRQCECGCKYFIPVVQVFTVSALLSPTGQELTAQQPVLVCMECKALLKNKELIKPVEG